MTSFVHTEYPAEHPGVARAGRAAQTLRTLADGFDSGRGAASLLLAAIVAAVLVVANQVIDTWTDGHLLTAWIGMWAIAFAALAVLAAPARRAVYGARSAFKRWAADRKRAAEDEKLWALALVDARVMADISRAMSRDASRDVRGYY